MNVLRLAAVGDNCVDRFRPPVSQVLIGGNALNVAAQCAMAGHESWYFGAVGPDTAGEATREALAAKNVCLDHLVTLPGETAYTDIAVEPSGERVFLLEEFGVCRGYRPDEAARKALLGMDHVHIGWLDDGGALRRWLVEAGVSCSQDLSINIAPEHLGVEGLEVAFRSGGDAADPRQLAVAMLAGGARLAVVTRGARGAYGLSATGEEAQVPAVPITPVDTTGAGDSFIAAFLIAHRAGQRLHEALLAGCAQAARTCAHAGGFPQVPGRF
ncbi:PfkB family carbohydrate kinase [Gellertiella hungarica]|uniref:Fructoselysine 6-kinase n=1 Tax=Gellertiella hungarica TaxID=1572859 RepID=A0A7W6NLD7_9HYPH|nr:PfkB family carbohydrate kinase [Gellertiella hungarica]MBB4066440.1 fructoselysine 6-kinase [Gellertiella hungarica]